MARGRRPDPPAVKELRGNPGKRPIPKAAAAGPSGELGKAPAQLKTAAAKRLWDEVGAELLRLNFLRPSDRPAFARYCETLARYWDVTQRMGKGGEVYTTSSQHGTMERIHPLFMVQERLARRLESMEDRFGLNPQARQQYLLRMAQAQMPLFGATPEPSKGDAGETLPAEAPDEGGPVGLLSRQPMGSA